jgi:hypothetical protein
MIKRALLPGLPSPNFPDPALQRWALAITERMEVREGARGDPLERVLTLKDLQKPATPATAAASGASPATLNGFSPIPTGNGDFVSLDINAVAEQLRRTKLYKELQLSISDPNRFDKLGTELKTTLTRSLAAEAAIRGAQISRSELIVNEVSRSVSATVTELTASIESASAGIRSTQFAIATETTAIAGQVTQLEARLQVAVDPADLLPVPPAAAYATLAALTSAVPAASADTRKYYRVTDGAGEVLYRSNGTAYSLVGTQGSAKLEQVLLVEADKTEGLSAQYTLKVSAGKAIAGFGIAATERDDATESAFIIQADKFALTTPYNFSQEVTPTAVSSGQTWYKPSTKLSYRSTAAGTGNWVLYTPAVPFAVDATTGNVAILGTLTVGGVTLDTTRLAAAAALPSASFDTTLQTKLNTGVANILAGQGQDWRMEVTSTSVIARHKDASLTTITPYAGDLKSGVIVNGAGLAMGYNDKTTGVWVNAVSINASGDIAIRGDISASSGTFGGNIATTGYVYATGGLLASGDYGAVVAMPTGAGVNGVYAITNFSSAAVNGSNTSTGNAIIGTSGGTAGAGVLAISTHTGGAALNVYNTQSAGIAIQLGGTGRISGAAIFQDNVTVSGTLNTAAISGTSGTFSGTVDANAITVSSTTRVANLNATRLYDKDWTEYCSILVGNSGTATASGAGFNITVGPGMSGSYAFTGSSNNMVLDVISDARLKKDVLQETLGLAFINALKPVTYRMISGTKMLHHGFIAQDVETVLGKGDDALTVENAEGIKGLNYTALIGPMAKAIQELTARIVALETP